VVLYVPAGSGALRLASAEEAAAAGRQPLLPHKIARRESGVV